MSKISLRGAVEWALMVALVFGAGAAAQAQNNDEEGNVVKIGQADNDGGARRRRVLFPVPAKQQAPKYWIGLLGGAITPDSPLRAHLDLPENQGLIVANIVPESPAAKAGLKQHDILLRANDNDLHEMQDLVDLVLSEGPKKGQITLEVLRHDKRETVYLTPEERPANAPMPQPMTGGFGNVHGGGGEFGIPNELLQQFGDQIPMQFRNFGPGVIVGGGSKARPKFRTASRSASIKRMESQPTSPSSAAKRRGPSSATIPNRSSSCRKICGRSWSGWCTAGGMKMHMPNFEQHFQGPGVGNGRLRDRLERMEQQLEELQKRLSGDHAPAAQPNDGKAETK